MLLQPSMLCYLAVCVGIAVLTHYVIKRYIVAVAVALLACHLVLVILGAVFSNAKVESVWSPYCILFSLTFATPVALVTGIPFVLCRIRKGREERDNAGRPLCGCCGYDLTGNISGICPECGTPISEEARRESTNEAIEG